MPHQQQNPARMSADEIIREIRSLRQEIEQRTTRISELALSMYTRARRHNLALPGEEEPEDSTPFLVFANAWARMSASLRQGIQRMSRTDRVIVQRTTEEPDEEEAAPLTVPELPNPTPPPPRVQDEAMEELVTLYGGEIVHDALTR